ncbi:hypothetical protein [Desulfosporosinus sp. BG]|uniref:hypothetical protein n=1 Tax=Desulfosporosinus sp. BG TaxID=1633135 RepID=UPI00083AB703|nr:hypothetical protein [Desulfosporosinus sp. BG]ODA39090.1 hypothetical protein DSBG_4134 [Desulfosporosinus sp. BG]
MYDTALGPMTQSKLTVQAPGFGERGASFGDSILFGIAASAILYPTPVRIPRGITASAILSTGDYRTGDYRAKSAILGALAAAHVLVCCPVSGVGRLNGSLLIC